MRLLLPPSRGVGLKGFTAGALRGLANVAQALGDHPRTRALLEESLALSREMSDRSAIAQALLGLARLARAQGDHPTARALLEEAHPFSRGTDASMEHGRVLLEMGDYAAARSCYEEGLALRRAGGGQVAAALLGVGHAAWLQGQPLVTRSHAVEALGRFQALEDKDGILATMESLAVVALAQGLKEHAARLLGAVEAQRVALRLPGPGWWHRPRECIGDAVRAASLPEALAGAWAEGRAMALHEVVAFALTEEA